MIEHQAHKKTTLYSEGSNSCRKCRKRIIVNAITKVTKVNKILFQFGIHVSGAVSSLSYYLIRSFCLSCVRDIPETQSIMREYKAFCVK